MLWVFARLRWVREAASTRGKHPPCMEVRGENDLANCLSHSWMVAITCNVSGCAMMVSISLVFRSVSRQHKASCPA